MREVWDETGTIPLCFWLIGNIGVSNSVVIGSVFIEQFIAIFDA
jgi:hypothetical protein